LRRLPDDVLLALYQSSEKVMKQLTANDPMAAKVYESYQSFYEGVRAYHHISAQAYINARDVVIDAPKQ
jgi:TRAP-type mannitol/chloroaromatic compound transport system substrate-binding protein